MAKIIKVGSQNPTFTSQKIKKASPLHTHRNSNEVTNPFKFTNFEGNTLQFADVFEGFRPSFKASPVNKLRMVASSVAGSMNKMKSSVSESIVNFANRVRTNISNAWAYAKNTDILDVPVIKKANEVLNAPIHIPALDSLSDRLAGMREGLSSRLELLSSNTIDLGNDLKTKWNGLVSNISNIGKSKYENMSVAELRVCLADALAEGGINE